MSMLVTTLYALFLLPSSELSQRQQPSNLAVHGLCVNGWLASSCVAEPASYSNF